MLKKGNYQFKIIISGFDVQVLDDMAAMFVEKLSQLKANFSLIYPKTREERKTVLIAPHKHKGAQKQYGKDTHYRKIFVANLENLVEKLGKLAIPNTVNIRIKVEN